MRALERVLLYQFASLLSLLLLTATSAPAATVSQYSVAYSTAAYTPLTTYTQVMGDFVDEFITAPIALGFTFRYADVDYTSFQISSNGFVRLGADAGGPMPVNDLAVGGPVVAPFWDDLRTDATVGSVRYRLIGAAPERVAIVEFRNMRWDRTASGPNASCHVRLFEAGGRIEFVYGAAAPLVLAQPGGSIGLGDHLGHSVSLTPGGVAVRDDPNNSVTRGFTANTMIAFAPPSPHDFEVLTIVAPGPASNTPPHSLAEPVAIIRNAGTEDESDVSVVCDLIPLGSALPYTDTQLVSLPAQGVVQVTFAPAWFLAGEYTLRVRTQLATDVGPSQDEVSYQVYSHWRKIASLSTARASHTATPIDGGRILIVGGNAEFGPTATCEIFDSATGEWTPSDDMASQRTRHTATRLPDGRVFVAGGSSLEGALASSEIYDPSTGQWTTRANMHRPRYAHTATLLQSSKVLIIGGVSPVTDTESSAELYDPQSNSWTLIPNPIGIKFSEGTATLLSNGSVIVQGGSATTPTSMAFDGVTETWIALAFMGTRRLYATAALLPNGSAMVFGGLNHLTGAVATCESYTPNAWVAETSMLDARSQHASALLPSGRYLICGGAATAATPSALTACEIYDPSASGWTRTAALYGRRYSHTATPLPNGDVLVVGGRTAAGSSNLIETCELYTETSPLPSDAPPVHPHAAVLRLLPNVPNPFNPTTRIVYEIDRPLDVRMDVFDTAGRWLRLLEAGHRDAGRHAIDTDWSGLPSGVYLCRLRSQSGEYVTRKVILAR